MRIFSTFTGIGGFEKGIEQGYERFKGGFENDFNNRPDIRNRSEVLHGNSADTSEQSLRVVGYSEIDRYAIKVYERNLNGNLRCLQPKGDEIKQNIDDTSDKLQQRKLSNNRGVKNYGDITKINADELPDFDCLVGGFPCQAFSIAGKRKGFEDTRGTLFFDLARILRAKRPRLFIFENVKGLLNHDNGRTFKTIIQTIDELGYDCQWQVLNSKNFGVPQNRERVYIVGHLRGTPRPEVFPIVGADGEDTQPNEGRSAEIFPTIRATHYKNGDNQPLIKQLNHPTHSNNRIYASDGISPTLNTMQGGNRQPKIVAQRGRYNADGKTEQRLEPRPDDISNTLTSVQKDNMVLDDVRIRRLTPIECERLQGFPDNWTKYGSDGGVISDTRRYKALGNAITVNVMEEIWFRILTSYERKQ